MSADWLIGVAVFLPLVALIMPLWCIIPATVIAFACGIAWAIAIRDEL
jgi:hypothetical protein